MPNDADKSLKDEPLNLATARAGIRETAKWAVAASAGVVTLVVGGSSLSSLGSMDFGWRFVIAAASVFIGAVLCWQPFFAAVNVLTIRMRALDDILADATTFAPVIRKVDVILRQQNPLGLQTVGEVIDAYNNDRTAYYNSLPTGNATVIAAAKAVVEGRMSRVDQVMELCSTELLVESFDLLMQKLKKCGPFIILAFLIFAWAANPAKNTTSDLAKPLLTRIAWSADDEAALIAAGLSKDCMKDHALQLVAVAQKPALRTAAVAVPSNGNPSCAPVRIDITSAGRLETPK